MTATTLRELSRLRRDYGMTDTDTLVEIRQATFIQGTSQGSEPFTRAITALSKMLVRPEEYGVYKGGRCEVLRKR